MHSKKESKSPTFTSGRAEFSYDTVEGSGAGKR